MHQMLHNFHPATNNLTKASSPPSIKPKLSSHWVFRTTKYRSNFGWSKNKKILKHLKNYIHLTRSRFDQFMPCFHHFQSRPLLCTVKTLATQHCWLLLSRHLCLASRGSASSFCKDGGAGWVPEPRQTLNWTEQLPWDRCTVSWRF